LVERLAERDRGVLQQPAAFGAVGRRLGFEILLHPRVRRETLAAPEAPHQSRRPVQCGAALTTRCLIKPANLLRDHGPDPPGSLPLGENPMPVIGAGPHKLEMRDPLLPPVLPPRVVTPQKVVKIHRLRLLPDPTRRPEIRNPALRADPRPREGD